jgi:polysaccharide deacetylase family protein (PEP-CTERM system associated)
MAVENILSVDVEEWFHICGVRHLLPEARWPQLPRRVDADTRRILKILARCRVRGTFFILGYVAENHPQLVHRIQQAGHEIASHGYAHRRVYTLDPQQFRSDLRRAAGSLQRLTGQAVRGYRAPEWSIRHDSLWALDILIEEGFAYDSSMAPLPIIGSMAFPRIVHRRHCRRGQIWELPPLVAPTPLGNLPVGGGWGLRTFPYALIRNAIRRLNRRGWPAVVFFHPREFDPAVPRMRIPLVKRFVVEAGLVAARRRLERLLDDFSFAPAATVLKRLQSRRAL